MTASTELHAELSGLLASLGPAARRQLAKDIAKQLRERNQQRIRAQQNPDGSSYTPRKPQKIRDKKGTIRRQMFAKLRTASHFKMQSTPEAATVGFTGRVARIARVHQLGLRDIVNRITGAAALYPRRELLGVTDADSDLIADLTLKHLSGS